MPASRRSRNCFGVASSSGVLRSASVFQLNRARMMATKLPSVAKMKRLAVALGPLEVAGDGEPDEESDVHAGVVPEESSFAARILRGEALRQHHVDAGDVEAAAGEEEGEADVEHRGRAGRDAPATDDLQRHAPDEEIPVREETPAQVAAEEVQPVVESAKHAHQRRGHLSPRAADASSRRGPASSKGRRSRASRRSE